MINARKDVGSIMTVDTQYLNDLNVEVNKKLKRFRFSAPDETGAEITYIATKQKIHWPGNIDSLNFRYQMQSLGIVERKVLRKGTQNYFRVVKRSGKLLRIDLFSAGRLDVIYLFHYEANKRYAFPFSQTGGFYPTYTQVQVYDNHSQIVENYMVRSLQIVHHTYTVKSSEHVDFRYINYVVGCQPQLIGIQAGYYKLGEHLTYVETYNNSNQIMGHLGFDRKEP